MLLIVLTGVVFGGIVHLSRRSERFRMLASMHSVEAKRYADIAWAIQRMPSLDASSDAWYATRYWALHSYHLASKAKYEQAAIRPWTFVAADPPAPVHPLHEIRNE